MEENNTQNTDGNTTQPAAPRIMDVVAPPPQPAQPTAEPSDDKIQARHEPEAHVAPSKPLQTEPAQQATAPKKPATGSSSVLAIIMAVLCFIGLAGVAFLAFRQGL